MSYEHDTFIPDATGRPLVSYGPRHVEGQSERVEPCAPGEAAFWGVYSHDAKGEVQIVGEASNAHSAAAFAEQIARTAKLEGELQVRRRVRLPNVSASDVFAGINYKQLSELAETVNSKEDLVVALEKLSVSGSSPRAHVAAREYSSGRSAEAVMLEAVEAEKRIRDMWIEKSFAPWCERHGLSFEQGLSVAFDDGSFNAVNPSQDRVTMRDVFDWGGQQNDFAQALQRELSSERTATALAEPRVVVITDGGVIQNIMSDCPVTTVVVDYDGWDFVDKQDKVIDVPQSSGGVEKARISLGKAEINKIEVESLAILAAEASEWSPEPERYIVLSIDTNTAAFADLGVPYEVARILRGAAVKLELGTPFKDIELYDTNGNAVGRISAAAALPELEQPGVMHLVINAVDDLAFGESEADRLALSQTFHFLAKQLVGVNDMTRRFTAFTVETRTPEGAADVKVGHSYYKEPLALRAEAGQEAAREKQASHGVVGLGM